MMLLGLLLWALVSAPAGGADVDEGWQVNQNSRPKLNVMMTCLGGCPVVRLVSRNLEALCVRLRTRHTCCRDS